MSSTLGGFAKVPLELRTKIYDYLAPTELGVIYPAYQTTVEMILRARERKTDYRRSARFQRGPPASTPSRFFVPRAYDHGRISDFGPPSERALTALLYASKAFNKEFLEQTLFKHTTFGFDINVGDRSTCSLTQKDLNSINNVLINIDTREYKTVKPEDYKESGLIKAPKNADALVAQVISRLTSAQRKRNMLHLKLHLWQRSGSPGELSSTTFLASLRKCTDFKTVVVELIPRFEDGQTGPDGRRARVERMRGLLLWLAEQVGQQTATERGANGGYSSDDNHGGTRDPRYVLTLRNDGKRENLFQIARLVEGDLLRKFEKLL